MNNDILSDFANMLQIDGFGTVGTDIFVGQMPAETNGIYLQRIGGELNNYLPIESTVVNVYVQNVSSQTAIGTIETIKRTYHRKLESGTDNSLIYTILVMGDVEDMGREIDFGKVYKLTLEITHRLRTLIS